MRKNIITKFIAIFAIAISLTGCGKNAASVAVITGTENAEAAANEETTNKDTAKSEKPSKVKNGLKTDDYQTADNLAADAEKTETEAVNVPVTIENPYEKYSKLSTWVVYWDTEGVEAEIESLGSNLDTIVCFEALYANDKTISHPEGCDELLNMLKEKYSDKTIYLSYVNDYQNADGSYSQKDVDLLREIFASEDSMNTYADAIVADAKASLVDGVELDYENMRKDEALFAPYARFIEILYNKCIENELSFRVATEYQTGIKCQLINGPEYVVMCYNLYGYGTSPGPKADMAYLAACYENFAYLEHVVFAFSLGGFKWNGDNVSALKENEALNLANLAGADIQREPSGAAYYSFEEVDKTTSTVYYADGATINSWKGYIKDKGRDNFALWRLGGNVPESLREMTQ